MSKTRSKVVTGEKMRAEQKMARLPVRFDPTPRSEQLRKPKWIRAKFPGTKRVIELKSLLRKNGLHTVCEEACCPNLGECFDSGTATFMIMGDICTRRCPFCDVAHGRPNPLDPTEAANLGRTVKDMELRYIVITSVDRDDLRDGGAAHFANCINEIRNQAPDVRIEILTPDFRGRADRALEILAQTPPDVFNHNLETIPRLYRRARPGADYKTSLDLLQSFKQRTQSVPTKSGLMLGLGEDHGEILEVLEDLRLHEVDMVTLGQYLQPTLHHLPVERYWTPGEFRDLEITALEMGFHNVAAGPMVRSSYHADLQARDVSVKE